MAFDLDTAVKAAPLVKTILGTVPKAFSHLRQLLPRRAPEFLAIVPETGGSAPTWHRGSQGNAPVDQLGGQFLVTNRTDQPFMLVRVEVEGARGKLAEGRVLVQFEGGAFGRGSLDPGVTTSATFILWLQPTRGKVGEPLTLRLAFADNLERKRVVDVTFAHR